MSQPVFRGGPLLKLDDKSRLTVPAKYKDALLGAPTHGQLVVAKNPDRCLWIFPLPVWLEFEADVRRNMKQVDAAWRRLYIGSAQEVEIDSAGRVLIAPELREWAGMVSREVKLMGMGEYFELWDSARYAESENRLLNGERPATVLEQQFRWPGSADASTPATPPAAPLPGAGA
jgi:MraZ protein